MTEVKKIKENLRTELGRTDVSELCVKLIDFLIGQPDDQLKMLTYPSFSSSLSLEPFDENLISAVSILSTALDSPVLSTRFLFVDDDDQEFEVDAADFSLDRSGRHLIHPNTGEKIPEPDDHVYMYFTPSEEFMKIKRGENG